MGATRAPAMARVFPPVAECESCSLQDACQPRKQSLSAEKWLARQMEALLT